MSMPGPRCNVKFALERHLYAPELNRVHIGPTALPAPGCRTIAEARKKLFAPLARKGRYTAIKAVYPEPLAHLSREHYGFLHDTAHLGLCLKIARALHNVTPAPTITVHTRLLG